MTSALWIDLKQNRDTVPRILDLINDGGFALREIRLIPSHNGERSSLCLDLAGCHFEADLLALEEQLVTLGEDIERVHCARRRSSGA